MRYLKKSSKCAAIENKLSETRTTHPNFCIERKFCKVVRDVVKPHDMLDVTHRDFELD